MALPNGDLITTVFDPQMAYPVDKRMQVDTLNSRDSISMFIRWEGMTVYVLEDSKIYILQGGRSNEFWKELGTGSGTGGTTFVGQFATSDLLPTTGRSAGDYAFVGTGDDFVQYNWDNISSQWVMAEGQTDMASEFFHIGYKTPLRRPVIFPLSPKDVLVETGGDFVFAPATAVARFIFTGVVDAVRGIETAEADREIKLVNRTGSDIPLRDKASGIPSGSGMDFGGTDYTWVNGSEITLKGNGTYWQLAPNNQVAFSDHLDSVNAQVSVGSDGLQVINGIFDNITKQEIAIKETNEFVDGSTMDDTKVDGFVFRKLGNKFFVDTDIWTNLKINPKKLGAKGDGITDDTDAIKASFLIADKLGATIEFPSGIFKVTDTIPMFATCSINGAGIEKTVILSHLTDNKHVFEYIDTDPITFNRRGIRVSNICVKGKTNLLTATDGYAFVFGGLYENSFDNVQVRFMGGGAIWAKEGESNFVTKVTNCDFNFNSRNTYWRNIDMGVIHWEYTGGTNGLNVIDTYISNNAGMHGIYYIGLAGRFISTTIESGLDGIRLGKENFPHTAAITMVGCYFENNNVDINVVEAEAVNVSSSYFSVSSDISIQIYRLRGGNFTNNRFGSSSNGVTVLQGAGSNSFGWREDIKFENNSNLKFIGSPDLSGITVVDGIYENNPYGSFGSAENLISESDNFDSWVKIGTPTLVKNDVFIDGREAYTLTRVTSGTEILYLPIVANEDDEITFSVYISCTERCYVRFRGLRISDGVNENFNGQYVNTNGKWQKISLSTTVSHTGLRIYINATDSGVRLCRANLNRGLVASKSIFTNGIAINEVSAVSNGDHYFAEGIVQKASDNKIYRKKTNSDGSDSLELWNGSVWEDYQIPIPDNYDFRSDYFTARLVTEQFDLNTSTDGFLIRNSAPSIFLNAPTSGYWLIQSIRAGDATIQMAWSLTTDGFYIRRYSFSSWGSWIRIDPYRNALNTASTNLTFDKSHSNIRFNVFTGSAGTLTVPSNTFSGGDNIEGYVTGGNKTLSGDGVTITPEIGKNLTVKTGSYFWIKFIAPNNAYLFQTDSNSIFSQTGTNINLGVASIGRYTTTTGSAGTFTIPADTFVEGLEITGEVEGGTKTFVAGAGVTLRYPDGQGLTAPTGSRFIIKFKSANDALVTIIKPYVSVSTFNELTDTPASKTGNKNKTVKVSNDETTHVYVADGVDVRNISDSGSIAPTLTDGFIGSRLNFTSSTAVTLQGFTSAGGQSSVTLVNPHATNDLTLVHNGAGAVKYIDAGSTDLVIAPKTAAKVEIVGDEIYRVI